MSSTWTPLRPGEIVDCAGGCGRKIAGAKTARLKKVSEHKARGRCAPCAGGNGRRDRDQRAGLTTFSMELDRPLGDWRTRAACRGADPSLFEERTMSGPVQRVPQEILMAALRYCQGCPVLSECKAEADANPALRGLLGGVYRTLNMRSATSGAYRSFNLLDPDYLEGI